MPTAAGTQPLISLLSRRPDRWVIAGCLLLFSVFGEGQQVAFKDSLEIHRTDTIYFDFASHELGEAAGAKIVGMAQDRPGNLHLYLEGHTDAVGTVSANEKLAKARSETTREAFIQAGWPAETVQLYHFGERRLSVPTSAREVRNRRVLMRSGLPKRYALLTGILRGENDEPLPGGAIAHGTYLQDTVTADQEGRFEVWLPLEDSLQIDLFAPGHFIENREYYLTDSTPLPPLEVKLQAATVGKIVNIDKLYFVGNRTVFLPESHDALDRLYLFMDYNKRTRIELAGHVNHPGPPQGPGTWQHSLAGARAKTVYNYLVDRGIEPERLRFKSYSNYEMVNPTPKDAKEMKANRRVEIRVLSSE